MGLPVHGQCADMKLGGLKGSCCHVPPITIHGILNLRARFWCYFLDLYGDQHHGHGGTQEYLFYRFLLCDVTVLGLAHGFYSFLHEDGDDVTLSR